MIHNKFRYILTLVALFAISTGAWADDLSESFTTNTGASAYTGEHFKITPHTMGVGDSDGFCIYYDFPATIEALNGETITKVEFTTNDTEGLLSDDGTVTYNGKVATVSDVNATSMTVIADNYIFIRAVKVYYTAGPEVTWNAATKTGTFTQPGYNVVLTPVYAPAAAFATEGEEPNVKTLAPTAAEGVIAGTDAPLIVEGTVAAGQGTVMYFATTEQLTAEQAAQANGWLSTLPTAANIADDGATVYVWYYIAGTDTPDGQEATAENTFNDSEICAQPLEVIVLSNKFDITFNAANANTIEAGKATVKVGETAATVTEGKLKAVKMGSTVTITTKEGYKFRKVEAKKAGAATYTLLSAATTADVGKVVCADGHLHDAKTAVPDGCTAVGILANVTDTGHGLILALQNATIKNWNSINGWTSVTTYAGTTMKVLPDDAARSSLTSYTTLGETTVSNWAVAQKSDYEAIFTNLGSTKKDNDGTTYDANVNAFITTGVGGTAISGSYWSATDKYDDNAWVFFSNYWDGDDKEYSHSVRPVLGF